MERTFIFDSKLVIHRNTIKSTCTQNFKKTTFGSKKYLTSKSSEVQKAQDQAPKTHRIAHSTVCTSSTGTLWRGGAGGGRQVKGGWPGGGYENNSTQNTSMCTHRLLPFTGDTWFVVLRG